MNNKISIITPMFNAAKFIEQAIQSVLNQTYDNWEMIIVDDYSNDNSIEVVRVLQKKEPRLKLIALAHNSGAAVARNKAIEVATGRFLAFLDSDDLWEPNKLSYQLKYMLDNNYSFTYTRYGVLSEKNETINKKLNFPSKVNYESLLKTCSIGCLTVMLDLSKFSKVEMPNLRRGQDYALWLALLKEVEYAYCVPKILAHYRILMNSLSRNKFKKLKGQWRVYRDQEELSIFKSLYFTVFYVYFGFKKNR